jgi:hypothetical protein
VEWVGWTDTWAPGPDEVEDVDECVEAWIDEGDDEVGDDEDATVGRCVVGLAGSAVVAVRTSEGSTTPVDPVTGLFILLFWCDATVRMQGVRVEVLRAMGRIEGARVLAWPAPRRCSAGAIGTPMRYGACSRLSTVR